MNIDRDEKKIEKAIEQLIKKKFLLEGVDYFYYKGNLILKRESEEKYFSDTVIAVVDSIKL
jgi:hypothetical protein